MGDRRAWNNSKIETDFAITQWFYMTIYTRTRRGVNRQDRGVCPFFSSLGSGKPRGDVKYVSCENERGGAEEEEENK